MANSSRALFSVFALAILAACGGGGQEPTRIEAVAAASPRPTSERAVTLTPQDSRATNAFPAANTSPESPDSVPYVDALVAHRVQAELDKIERALRQVDDSKIEKREALEVVSDARAELQKDQPNKLKLRSLLSGLVQGVQTLDGVKSAGDFLGRLVPMV